MSELVRFGYISLTHNLSTVYPQANTQKVDIGPSTQSHLCHKPMQHMEL